jgi:hypothetical protein
MSKPLEFIVTSRDLAARQDLGKVQADVMHALQGIDGVSWKYNDPGAQAVVIELPSDQVGRVQSILSSRYMVDPNAGLQQL